VPPQRVPQPQARAAATPQAAAAVAVDSAPPATGTAVPASYFGELEALIRSTVVYPPGSIAKGEEGICKVLVSFSRDGTIHGAELVQDSGHSVLDGECLAVFRRIGRFPPVPQDTSPNVAAFAIELPITYSLQ
jgi:protein TonB